MSTPRDVSFYIDGSSLGNPGEAGVGIVVASGDDTLKNISAYIGRQTNNVAEYTALVTALEEALAMKCRRVRVFTDSELLQRQMTGVYRVKNEAIKTLHERAMRLANAFEAFAIERIPREMNKGADKLARMAVKYRDKNTSQNGPVVARQRKAREESPSSTGQRSG